ncbi:hypothetical protein SAMN06297387_108209 [Streptomyces zhaozhouensis]|uniref:Uncharacterized protein n=1 Tax=Streptomyces zhaozhouensis TaxID=1300267 RepID=A0A286DWN3_9ACTN|nr:hypothetical protein [Streptomyces zhaozhouensis]SOD63046.1 hypothetical protein SAMN06297387_108209 [Streptomyces zhaozhouensis]
MDVTFDVPAAFTSIPPGMTHEETLAYTNAQAVEHPSHTAPDPAAVERTQAVSQVLSRMGTLYAGAAFGLISEEPSAATLLVTAQSFPYGADAQVAAEGTLQALVAERGPNWTGGVQPLPCGQPAAVVVGGRVYELPGSERPVPFAELQAFIPVPENPTLPEQALLAVTFTTPALRHWEQYMPAVTQLLRTLTFAEKHPVS